jgi:chromosome partitioning protein
MAQNIATAVSETAFSKQIPNTIAFANGKGGVGKTSLSANCGGLAAAGGWRVLILDLDPQGNLARDLGYDVADGQDLLNALITGTEPPLLKDVRPGLDVVPGGPTVADIQGLMFSRANRSHSDDDGEPETLGDLLFRSLSGIAANYDLILFDTPPGDVMILDAVLACCQGVVIPTRADEGSLDGLTRIAKRFKRARRVNPDLRLAGVVLFGIGSRSSRLEDAVRDSVYEIIGESAPVFDTYIRYLETAGFDLRRHGILAHELETQAAAAQKGRLKALRAGTKPAEDFLARNATGLAEDYEKLTMEIIGKLTEINQEVEAVS